MANSTNLILPDLNNPVSYVTDLIKEGLLTADYLERVLRELGVDFPAGEAWMPEGVRQWDLLETLAQYLTRDSAEFREMNTVLIGIKAQHPLLADGHPGDEYESRLLEALAVADGFSSDGYDVKFAVVGDIHDGCKTVSLAEAGKRYLVTSGVPEADIYMKTDPLCGMDEDLFFANLYHEKNFSALYVVMSTGQMPRTMLEFLMLGTLPTLVPVTQVDNPPRQRLARELFANYGINALREGGPAAMFAVAEKARQRHREEMAKEA